MGHGKIRNKNTVNKKKQSGVLFSLPSNTSEMKYTKSVTISLSKPKIFGSTMMPFANHACLCYVSSHSRSGNF